MKNTQTVAAVPLAETERRHKLILDNLKLAYHFAKRFGTKLDATAHFRELDSACLEALCRSAAKWDPHRGIKFSTYVGRACWRACVNAVGDLCRQGIRGAGKFFVSSGGNDTDFAAKRSGAFDGIRGVDAADELRAVLELLAGVPKRWRLAVRAVLTGTPVKEVADLVAPRMKQSAKRCQHAINTWAGLVRRWARESENGHYVTGSSSPYRERNRKPKAVA